MPNRIVSAPFFRGTTVLMFACVIGCSSQTDIPVQPNPSTDTTADLQSPVSPEGEASTQEFVIDVRSQSEWESGHVQQAVHIPHTEIASRIAEVTSDKDAKIVVYCAVGGRAGKAKSALEDLGYKNVENAGGYDDIKQRYQ